MEVWEAMGAHPLSLLCRSSLLLSDSTAVAMSCSLEMPLAARELVQVLFWGTGGGLASSARYVRHTNTGG
jgi:hypothetical protein